MSISGLVIHAHPERIDDVRARLEGMTGVEVHTQTDDGKMVVTVDIPDDHAAGDTLLALQREEGVLSAALIYNHFETDSDSIPAD